MSDTIPPSHVFECQRCGRTGSSLRDIRDGCRQSIYGDCCLEPVAAIQWPPHAQDHGNHQSA